MSEHEDISAQLRKQRQEYVTLRARAATIAQLVQNTDLGIAMDDQCRILDSAIAGLDMALKIGEGS